MDHLPQIAEDLSRRAVDIQMLGDHILIECNPREGMIGSLYIPTEALEAYPTSGWVFAVGPKVQEDLSIGDFVLIEEEGLSLDYSYYDVFEITLRHDDGFSETIFADIEAEHIVREQVSTYRRGGSDTNLSLIDRKNGGSISFECSNVLDWQMGQIANPSYDLTYIPVCMLVILNEDEVPTLFYMTKESRILATVEYDLERADSPLQSDRSLQEAAHGPY